MEALFASSLCQEAGVVSVRHKRRGQEGTITPGELAKKMLAEVAAKG